MQPKYALYFYDRCPGAPFAIIEHAIVDGKVAGRTHSTYRHLQDALEALARMSAKPVMIAYTTEMAE